MPCPCLRVRAESASGDGNFSHGSFASIEAVADEGHTFTGWTGSGVTDGNALSTTVLMDQNQSVTATFSRNAYTLRVYRARWQRHRRRKLQSRFLRIHRGNTR